MEKRLAAAFYDMDGTLVSTNLVHSFLFMAMNEPSIPGSLLKTATGIAKIPLFAAVDQVSRLAFNELLFAGYKGAFEDRLMEFASEHFEKVLKPNIFPGAADLVKNAKKRGLRQVIVSGSLDFMVAPLAKHLGVDDLITNRLEFQEYAQKWNIDLLESYGFSDSYSDYAMLSVVGRPAVVNPDKKLRRSAEEHNWPILDVR